MGLFDGLQGKLEELTADTKKAVAERDRQQWEYLVINMPVDISGELNRLGSQRWELAQVLVNAQQAILKRPKLEDINEG